MSLPQYTAGDSAAIPTATHRSGGQPDGAMENSPLLGQRMDGAPTRKQKLWGCVTSVFPDATWRSLILPISVIQYVVYIIACCLGSWYLFPADISLQRMGALDPPWVKHYGEHTWRLFAPMFLNATWMQLVFSVFFQLRTGFSLEKRLGLIRTLLIYLLCGLLGSIFSAAVLPRGHPRVGSNVPGFGLLGVEFVYLAFLGFNHPRFEMTVVNLICFTALLLAMRFDLNGAFVDQLGSAGALLGGLAFGLACLRDPSIGPKTQKVCFWIGVSLLVVLWTTLPCLLYLL